MSGSTDSLKKKVCVTVFLDELFEEVEEEERREPKQVSEVTESVGKMAEKPFKEPSRVDLDNDERINLSPNADIEQNQVQVRPRKHRRESKFSKNRYDSFKNELSKYGYGSMKVENEGREPVDSAFSDSDFDLDEFLGLDKWTLDKSASSFVELSEGDLTGESFLSIRPPLSITKITSLNKRQIPQLETVLYCNKSTQFEAEGKESQSAREDKKKAKGKCQDKGEACEGDRLRHYDLGSLLKESVSTKREQQLQSIRLSFSESCDESESLTCVLPLKKKSCERRPPEVKKVWTSTRGVIWNDGFESELSEADCGHQGMDKESLVCCTLRLECEEGESSEKPEGSSEKVSECRSSCKEPSPVVIQAVAHVKVEPEKECGLAGGAAKGPPPGEARSKNFAEGDTIGEPPSGDSQYILDLDAKEKLFVCGEILKHVGETKVIRNEIIVNRAEIELHPKEEPQEEAETVNLSPPTPIASEVVAEVFFNQKRSESLDKSLTDVESEMVFAESENYGDSEDFFCSKFSIGPAPSPALQGNHFQKDICVLEFEDKLSRTKILRRMKTVEILGDNSLNDMKNISTEVILICENISSNEVCLEAWQSSASTLRSISEMKQCYLKDSRDSAMYLIEIPLHFKKEKPSHSEHFFKPSESD